MKRLIKLIMFMFVIFLWWCIPVKANNYMTLNTDQLRSASSIQYDEYGFQSYMRIFIPPGTTYINLSYIGDASGNGSTVSRFGMAPSGYSPGSIPYWGSNAKQLSSARTDNIYSTATGGGMIGIVSGNSPVPLTAAQAGWFYIDSYVSAIWYIRVNLSVDPTTYNAWYDSHYSCINECPCAASGTCSTAMCPSCGGNVVSNTVNFTANPSNGGYVNYASQSVAQAQQTSPVTATAYTGYTFMNWKDQSSNILSSTNVTSTSGTLPAQTISASGATLYYTAYFQPVTYTISGNVGISGVTMSISTGGSTISDGSGNYSFTGISSGSSGTVTPSKSLYNFTPQNQPFSNITANQTFNFSATPMATSYSISGYVKDSSNVGISGVTMTLSAGGATTTTLSDGSYSFSNIAASSSGTVSPYKIGGYTFNPTSRPYSASQTTLSFTGTVPVTPACINAECWAQGKKCVSGTTGCVDIGALDPLPIIQSPLTFSGTQNIITGPFTASTTKSVLEPTVTFSKLPCPSSTPNCGIQQGQFDLYAAIVENGNTIFVTTKDKVGNTVFVDYRSGFDVWFRSYERRSISVGQSVTFYPFNGVDLNLTSSNCKNYQFFVGITPAGTTLTNDNFASVFYGAVFQCNN